jgi:hypothetical protein
MNLKVEERKLGRNENTISLAKLVRLIAPAKDSLKIGIKRRASKINNSVVLDANLTHRGKIRA